MSRPGDRRRAGEHDPGGRESGKRASEKQEGRLLRAIRHPRNQPLLIAVLAVLLSLLAIGLVIIVIGKNPISVFRSLLQGSGWLPKPRYASSRSMLTDFCGLLDAVTPMLFAAIAVSIAFKAGLFNIGVSGQMLAAGFLATVIVGYSSLGAVIARPLVLLIGMAAGAALAMLVGWLKARFNIHEVVATIMLNYIVQYIVGYFVKSRYIDPISRQSRAVSAQSRLTLVNVPVGAVETRIPLCFLLAVLLAVLFYLILRRTRLGFEIRAIGSNRQAAEYSGISVNKTTITAMALSGMAAGLAGVTYYLGYFNCINPGELSRVGFDSIAVAMLASSNPLACVLSSLLITTLGYGSNYMSSVTGVSEHIASLLIGIVLLFSACGALFGYFMNRGQVISGDESGGFEGGEPDGRGAGGSHIDVTGDDPVAGHAPGGDTVIDPGGGFGSSAIDPAPEVPT